MKTILTHSLPGRLFAAKAAIILCFLSFISLHAFSQKKGGAAPTSFEVSYITGTTGSSVSLSATLTSNGNPLLGFPVVFSINGTTVGSSPTLTGGVATYTIWLTSDYTQTGTPVNVGTYSIGASYIGSAGYDAASGSATLTVTANTNLAASNSTGTYGGTASFTATLTQAGNNNPVSNETITFNFSGATVSGTTDVNGVATVSASLTADGTPSGTPLAAGPYSITASFAGDANYIASTSTAATLTVNPPPTLSVTGAPAALSTTSGTASSSTSFGITGSNLVADNITVAAPPGFDVSPDNSTWSTPGGSYTIAETGSVSSTVYIQLDAGDSPGSYSGNITISGGGATALNVAVPSSTVSPAPIAISSITANSTYSNAGSITFTVTFAAPITGLSAGNFSLTTTGTISGASVNSVSSGTNSYTVTVNTGTGDGTIGLNLANATGLTPGISTTLPFAGETTTIDKTPPTITISSPSVSSIVAGASSVTYSVTYADANFNTSTLSTSDIMLNATGTALGTIGLIGSGTSYTVTISDISGAGTLGISIAGGTASDLAGNLAPESGASATFDVVTPTISLSGSPSTLSTTTGTASSSTSFDISGTNLIPGNLTVTAPAGFDVSSNNSTWSGSGGNFTIAETGTLSSTPVYIRLDAGDTPNSYSGNVSISGGGATTVPVPIPLSTVLSKPVITTSGTPSALSTISGTASPSTSFDVSGTNLTAGNLTVTAPAGFDVSSNNSTWSGSGGNFTIAETGTLSSTPVYIRLDAGDAPNSYSGNVSISGGGATTVTVPIPQSTVSAVATTVNTITASSSYSNAGSIIFTVTFAAPITGLSTSNFSLTTTGGVSGASINSVNGSGASYTVTVNTGTGDGTIGLNLANATGLSPGISTGLPFAGGTVTIDKTPPTITISQPSADTLIYGAAPSVTYTVTYADVNFSTSTLTAANITVNSTGSATASSIGVQKNSSTSYTVTFYSYKPTGTLGFSIAAGTASDLAGNLAPASGPSPTFSVVTEIISVSGTPSALSTISGTASPSTMVSVSGKYLVHGLQAIAPAGFEVSADNSTFSNKVDFGSAPTTPSTPIYIRLKASDGPGTYSGIVDFLGASAQTSITLPSSTVYPLPVIATSGTLSALGTTSGTASSSTSFNVSGENLMAGITVTAPVGFDVSLDGSAWSTSGGSVTIAESGGSITSQTVYIQLDAGDVANTDSGNIVLSSAGAITVNVGMPTSSVSSPTTISSITANSSYSNASAITFAVRFAASVTGLSTANFSLTTSGVSGPSITSVSGSGTSYTVTVNTGSGEGTIRLNLANATGISPDITTTLPFTGGTTTIDDTPPTISIGAPSVSIANQNGTVTYTVTYADAHFNTSTISTSDITLNQTGGANADISVSVSGHTATVYLTNITGNGTLGISVGPNTASDLAGNEAPAAGPSATFAVNNTPPVVSSITAATPGNTNPTNATSVTYTVTLSEAVTGLNPGDFNATTGGSVIISDIVVTPVSGSVYSVTVDGISGTGTLRLDFYAAQGDVTDAAGNVAGVDFTSGDTYNIDNNPPSLTSQLYTSGNSNPAYAKVGDAITLSFDANKPIQTPVVTIAGHSVIAANTGGNNYSASYTMTSSDTEGRIPFTLAITDIAGNSVNYTDVAVGDDITFDMTPPTIAIGPPSVSSIVDGAGSVTYSVTYADANFNTSTLVPGNITLNATGTAGGTVGLTENTSTSYTVTISGITGAGTLGISIVAGTASDFAGNLAPASAASATFTAVTPTISPGGALSALSTITGTASSSTSFDVSGTNMEAGILVTPPTGFEVSTDNSTFSSTVTVGSSGTISSTTVYIRLAASDAANSYSGNIALTSTGATTVNVAVSGTVLQPTISSPNGTVTLISTTAGTPGPTSTFFISATNLSPATGNLTITAPTNVQVSPAGNGPWSSSYIQSYSGSNLGPTPVYTRLSGTGSVGIISGNVQLSGGGATTVNQPVFGTLNAAITTINSLTAISSTLTNAASVQYTATFAASVSGLSASDFSVNESGVSGASVSRVTQITVTTYNITVGTGSGDGTLQLEMNSSDGVSLSVTNLPFTGTTYTIDKTAPTASISGPSLRQIGAGTTGTVTYTVTYADANFNTSNLTNAGITLNTTGTATGTVNVSGSGTSYTVTISNITGAGTLGISVGAGYASDRAGNTDAGSTPSATFNVLSNDALLSNVTLNAGPLTPGFSANVTSYLRTLVNGVNAVTIVPTTDDPGATILINGTESILSGATSDPLPVSVGSNTITVQVTAADGVTTQTYTLTLIKNGAKNDLLTSLKLSKGTLSPVFAGTNGNYTASVANGVTSLTVTPTTANANATLLLNGVTAITSGTATGPIALSVGPNTITVQVTAQNDTATRTYTITVTRAAAANDNLVSLKPSRGTLSPAFATLNTNYTASVVSGVSSMTVTPTAADPEATILVNGTDAVTSGTASGPIALAVGPNTITVKVTAADGITHKTYTLTVTRAAASADGYVPIAIGTGISVTNPTETPTLADDGIVVHQAISPNGDGINDFLQIDNISQYPDNKLSIMNRNGQLVYQAMGYDNSSKVFDGHSNKNGQMQLPGTYFYQLDYTVNGINKHKTGFLVLKY